MKKLYAVLAAIVLLASVVGTASAATSLFYDNFNAGLGKWDSTVKNGNGYVVAAAESTCATKNFPSGDGKCLFAKTGPASGAGEAYVKELVSADYKQGLITDITASWSTYISPLTDNGTTLFLFTARAYFDDMLAIGVVYDPIGTTGARVRGRCQRADGTFANTDWLSVPVNAPFSLTAQFESGATGLCSVVVGVSGNYSQASVNLDNHGMTADYLRLGVVGTPNGLQVNTYSDNFVASGKDDTLVLIKQDDFEGSEPLSQTQWNPEYSGGVEPYKDDCTYSSFRCAYFITNLDLYWYSYSRLGYDFVTWHGNPDRGGVYARWLHSIGANIPMYQENAFPIYKVWDYGVNPYRVEYYQASLGHWFYRFVCLDNNGVAHTDANGGWMEADSVYVVVEATFKTGNADIGSLGYCALKIDDGATIQETSTFIDNSNWNNFDYLQFGLMDVPPNIYATMAVEDISAWYYLP